MKIGVRVDQPGTLLRDFQTARNDKGKSMPLSNRYYLTDAVFVVGIEGEVELIEGIQNALKRPRYPLYLGRRSCPPSFPLVLKTVDKPLNKALLPESVEWQAAPWFTKRVARKGYVADLVSDSNDFGEGKEHELEETVRDVPISFDMRNRQYSWRTVYRSSVVLCDPPKQVAHDPLVELEDA